MKEEGVSTSMESAAEIVPVSKKSPNFHFLLGTIITVVTPQLYLGSSEVELEVPAGLDKPGVGGSC